MRAEAQLLEIEEIREQLDHPEQHERHHRADSPDHDRDGRDPDQPELRRKIAALLDHPFHARPLRPRAGAPLIGSALRDGHTLYQAGSPA